MEVIIEDGDINGGVIEDSYLFDWDGGNKDSNFGAGNILGCLWYTSTKQKRSVFRVDLSALSGIIPITAYLGLDIITGMNFPRSIRSYGLIPEWTESEITWNSSKTGTAWDTGGASTSGVDRLAEIDNSDTVVELDDNFHFTVSNGLVQDSLGGWLSLLIESASLNGTAQFNIASSETSTGNNPYFYIEYVTMYPISGFWYHSKFIHTKD